MKLKEKIENSIYEWIIHTREIEHRNQVFKASNIKPSNSGTNQEEDM